MGPGTEGEIVGRSSSMMNGYWNRPDLTAELAWRSPEGVVYMRTGDVGELDAQGFLAIRGRRKDMIISGGINVFPPDIEAVLVAHPQVRDAAVTGIEDERWGERPVAVVILEQDELVSPEELQAWANARLGIEGEHWSIFLTGENLTDEDGEVSQLATFSQVGTDPNRARPLTYGIEVNFNF